MPFTNLTFLRYLEDLVEITGRVSKGRGSKRQQFFAHKNCIKYGMPKKNERPLDFIRRMIRTEMVRLFFNRFYYILIFFLLTNCVASIATIVTKHMRRLYVLLRIVPTHIISIVEERYVKEIGTFTNLGRQEVKFLVSIFFVQITSKSSPNVSITMT